MEENIYRWQEEYGERYQLARDRIQSISGEGVREPFGDYFRTLRDFALLALSEYEDQKATAEINRKLYQDLEPEHYAASYGNPACALSRLGEEYGPLLSAWYREMRGLIPFAYEKNIKDITVILETFIQLYNEFEYPDTNDGPTPEQLQDIFYSYLYDYCSEFTEADLQAGLEPADSLARRILMESDLSDLSYLYRYGEWVTESELGTAELLNSLSEEEICSMARAYTEGYLMGFRRAGKDLSRKSTVRVYLPLGFERFMRKAVEYFEEAGLTPIFFRNPVHLINRGFAGNVKPGFYGAVNEQFEYDHKDDLALFMGDRLKAEKLRSLKEAYHAHREAAAACSGNACVEIFGAPGFAPEERPGRIQFSGRREHLFRKLRQEKREMDESFLPEGETSFTIIAWPRPEVAEDQESYRRIFREVIALNTLPEDRYREIQQTLIDALDRAERVEIRGRGENRTDLTVRLRPLQDPEKETNFENCLADVNIPVGEVFTSPVLSGTEGTLHVGRAYISGYCLKDLYLHFKGGRVTDYGCGNGASPEEGKRLVEQVVFRGQTELPMGEFAIGTNTTAYALGERYGISDRLPVLIAEKTGPHFAVGDTCYAHEEDLITYNPDGKAITARSNECADLRNSEPEKAYFHVHTDITLPYGELALLQGIDPEGRRTDIIREGRFVLPGTEELNRPLEALSE